MGPRQNRAPLRCGQVVMSLGQGWKVPSLLRSVSLMECGRLWRRWNEAARDFALAETQEACAESVVKVIEPTVACWGCPFCVSSLKTYPEISESCWVQTLSMQFLNTIWEISVPEGNVVLSCSGPKTHSLNQLTSIVKEPQLP